MFTEQQLNILHTLDLKWQVWKQSQVSLFTHEDKLRIDEVRAAMGLAPANINCNACFMEDIAVIMNAYEQQKTGDNIVQGEATGTKRAKRKK